MGTLYLVRHGQASFGAADYDRLSPLGTRQCHALGEYLGGRGVAFEAVLSGSLRRQVQSLQALAAGHGELPAPQQWPGLNEYDADAIAAAVHRGPPPDPSTPEGYRAHFRLLREALTRWMAGDIAPAGVPTHADWLAGITAVLDHVRARHDGNVLIVSSGGPIAATVAQVLGAPPAAAIDLNLRIRNSAITELACTRSRLALISFNHLPHLDRAERRDWVTHT